MMFLAALAIVAMTAVTAEARSKPKPKKSKKVVVNGPTKQQAKFEVDFLKKMIDRHQRAITIATWIDQNTSVTELNAFAELFIDREQFEMQQMIDALKEWYNITYTPKILPIGEDVIESFEEADTPAEFVLAALEFFKGYDKNELAQMKQVERKAYHADFKSFAAQLILTDKAEIEFLDERIKYVEGLLE